MTDPDPHPENCKSAKIANISEIEKKNNYETDTKSVRWRYDRFTDFPHKCPSKTENRPNRNYLIENKNRTKRDLSRNGSLLKIKIRCSLRQDINKRTHAQTKYCGQSKSIASRHRPYVANIVRVLSHRCTSFFFLVARIAKVMIWWFLLSDRRSCALYVIYMVGRHQILIKDQTKIENKRKIDCNVMWCDVMWCNNNNHSFCVFWYFIGTPSSYRYNNIKHIWAHRIERRQ